MSLAEEGADAADRSPGEQAHRFPINLIRAMALAETDRADAAQDAIQVGRHVAEKLGSIVPVASYHWASGFERFLRGQWDDALAECEACRDVVDETRIRPGILFSYAVTALIQLHRDRVEDARASLEAAAIDLEHHGPRQLGLPLMLWAQGLLAEATGDFEQAHSILCSAWDLCAATGLVINHRLVGPDLVRMALRAGDPSRAKDAVTAIEALAADNPEVPTLTRAAQRCRGLLENQAESFLGAVTSYRQGSRPIELAMACEDAAHALTLQGRAGEALDLFERAISVYERLGAFRDLARAERSLRASGFRRGRRGRHRRPETGWQSLTETELKVVRLVASGMSNRDIAARLFLSHHTVNTHLSHVLAKLGHRSRVEIAAEAVRRDPQLLQS